MSLKNPVDAILDWYKSQPDQVRDKVATLLLLNHPSSDFTVSDLLASDPNAVFEKWVVEKKNKCDGRNSVVGLALTLQATIDFFVMRAFFGKESWESIAAVHQGLIKEKPDDPSITEISEDILRKIPFEQRQWMRSGIQWIELSHKELSTASLEEWLREGLADYLSGQS
jgi:hypothetical protein